MKANELRIGNLIKSRSGHDVLVNWGTLRTISNGEKTYSPIPLTEDILLKCGFEKYVKDNGSIRFVHDNCFYEVEQHGYKFPFVLEDYESYSIHYICHDTTLHSFQNSFKQLTGEELTVNL